MPAKNVVQCRFYLTPAQYAELKDIAKDKGIGQSELIRLAFSEFAETYEYNWPDDPTPLGKWGRKGEEES